MAEPKPATIKAKVVLIMWAWKGSDDKPPHEVGGKPPLEMTGYEKGVHTGFRLDGTVDLEKDELYEILRAAEEEFKKPLFVLEIL